MHPNYQFISDASIVLGIIVMITIIFSDIPKPYGMLTLFTMPIIVGVTYCSLMAIQEKRKP